MNDDLSYGELRQAYQDLVIEYAKQTSELRAVRIENDQLRKLAFGIGIDSAKLSQFRDRVLGEYLTTIPALKGKRGARKNYQDEAAAIELWRLYQNRENQILGFKTWLRKEIENDFRVYNVSLTARRREIEAIVNRWAVKVNRLKIPSVT